METNRKGTKVNKIIDDKFLKLKNYIMFEDSWITEYDKILYNIYGDDFLVLDYQKVTENVLTPYGSGWIEQSFSCIKLNKDVNVGDIFYTHL